MNKQDVLDIERLKVDRLITLHDIESNEEEIKRLKTLSDHDGEFYEEMALKYSQLDLKQIDLDIANILRNYPTE